MTLLKGRKFAQHGQTGGENAVYDATAGIAAPETASQYSRIPTSLKAKRIWLPFKTSPRPAGGVNKIPHNRQGRRAQYTDPSIWLTFEEARQQASRPGYGGIGIVLSEAMGIMGIDFDHCLVNGELKPQIEQWLLDLNTYTELSFSGDGLHAIVFGRLPWKANRKDSAGVEMYTTGRYFVVTGRQVTGTPSDIRPAQDAINAIHQEVFGNQPDRPWDTTAHTPYTGEGGGEVTKQGVNLCIQTGKSRARCSIIPGTRRCFWEGRRWVPARRISSWAASWPSTATATWTRCAVSSCNPAWFGKKPPAPGKGRREIISA